jgi:hypothetical protein
LRSFVKRIRGEFVKRFLNPQNYNNPSRKKSQGVLCQFSNWFF